MSLCNFYLLKIGFPGVVKKLSADAGDMGLIPEWEDPLEEDMATQSCILAWRISMDRGAWWATGHRVTKRCA